MRTGTAADRGARLPPPEFATRLLAWWQRAGRFDLPWQQHRTPYRVWVAEIMLQQTQVAAVIGYYARFMQAFPDLQSLAAAPLDEVLHAWSGLGYYARARNLHRAARNLVAAAADDLPAILEGLMQLPGIGRSTAGAILACAFGTRAPILDGNVKRVLARHRAVEGVASDAAVSRQLWALAEAATPHARVADYTQAIMDLGATVCTRARPRCDACPLAADCCARTTGRIAELPTTRRRQRLPERAVRLLVVRAPDGSVLLEQRPADGIWGGLWTFPELTADTASGGVDEMLARLHVRRLGRARELPAFVHAFTHLKLTVTPLLVSAATMDAGGSGAVAGDGNGVGEAGPASSWAGGAPRRWYLPGVTRIGVARPVTRILTELPRHAEQ